VHDVNTLIEVKNSPFEDVHEAHTAIETKWGGADRELSVPHRSLPSVDVMLDEKHLGAAVGARSDWCGYPFQYVGSIPFRVQGHPNVDPDVGSAECSE
jgi:hypothetical protein